MLVQSESSCSGRTMAFEESQRRRHGSDLELVDRFYRRMTPCTFIALFGGMGLMMSSMFIGWPFVFPIRAGFMGLFVITPLLSMVSVVLLPVGVIALMIRWEMRLMSRLKEACFKLCPHCGYPLTKATGDTTCPECGASCNIPKLEASWRAFRPRLGSTFLFRRWFGRREA